MGSCDHNINTGLALESTESEFQSLLIVAIIRKKSRNWQDELGVTLCYGSRPFKEDTKDALAFDQQGVGEGQMGKRWVGCWVDASGDRYFHIQANQKASSL